MPSFGQFLEVLIGDLYDCTGGTNSHISQLVGHWRGASCLVKLIDPNPQGIFLVIIEGIIDWLCFKLGRNPFQASTEA